MKSNQRWLVLIILILSAVLLAPIFRILLGFILIDPIVYYWKGIQPALAAIPQRIYWFFLIISLGTIAAAFILKTLVTNRRELTVQEKRLAPVQSLAESLARTQKSQYFRWLIANRLALLTYQILTPIHNSQMTRTKRIVVDLSNLNWDPPPEIKLYFQSGLDPSWMNKPRSSLFSKKSEGSQYLKINLNEVMDYIETLMEVSCADGN